MAHGIPLLQAVGAAPDLVATELVGATTNSEMEIRL